MESTGTLKVPSHEASTGRHEVFNQTLNSAHRD